MVKYRKIILPSGHTASVAGGNFTPSLLQRRSGAKLSNAPVEEKSPTVFNLVPKWFRYLKQCWGALIAKSWSSLVVGDEGPSGKLLCLCETLKNYAAQHGIIPCCWPIQLFISFYWRAPWFTCSASAISISAIISFDLSAASRLSLLMMSISLERSSNDNFLLSIGLLAFPVPVNGWCCDWWE